MKNYLLIILSFGLLTNGCAPFEQNDFLSTEYVGQFGDEKVIYSAFRTGIDNYRIEFKTIIALDTFKIFDYTMNDALYKKEQAFEFEIRGDTLFVLTAFQSCKRYYKTEMERTVVVTRTFDTKICDD